MEEARVIVVGASGYVGGELLRLISMHPSLRLVAVTSQKSAGSPVAEVFPHLTSVVPLSFEALEPERMAQQSDAVFLALPHTTSFQPASVFVAAGKKVVDLGADFRLKNPASYETWYQTSHPYPDLLREAVYGLPELHRTEISRARLVASPGCYPTAAILQLAPLVASGFVQPGSVIVDAKSGVSGAGRDPSMATHFPEAHESIEAYKIGKHRHTPEIEQELGALASRVRGPNNTPGADETWRNLTVAFTPHLTPMNRGILSTAYCRPTRTIGQTELRSLYQDFFKGEPFIRILEGERSANPRHVRGSNYCDLALFADPRTDMIITTSALDNLVKGAAGQAIQAMNLMLGFPEELGLTAPGVCP